MHRPGYRRGQPSTRATDSTDSTNEEERDCFEPNLLARASSLILRVASIFGEDAEASVHGKILHMVCIFFISVQLFARMLKQLL